MLPFNRQGPRGSRQAVLPTENVQHLVSRFYDDDQGFAGTTFLGLEPNQSDRVGPEDLLAVTFMGEIYPPYAVRQLLHGDLGAELSDLLRRIPNVCPIWKVSMEELDGAPTGAWELLRDRLRGFGVGPTRISKLLARKRPALIPIYDSVIGRHVAPVNEYWGVFHGFLCDE